MVVALVHTPVDPVVALIEKIQNTAKVTASGTYLNPAALQALADHTSRSSAQPLILIFKGDYLCMPLKRATLRKVFDALQGCSVTIHVDSKGMHFRYFNADDMPGELHFKWHTRHEVAASGMLKAIKRKGQTIEKEIWDITIE